jgi:S-adenosylmethionine synthetase
VGSAAAAAKNIVAAGLAERCVLQIAYAIGERQPLSILADTSGTNKIPEHRLVDLITAFFDFTPQGIIKKLNLRRPIYRQTAAYGHFGRTDLNVPWEDTDMAETLRKEAGV